MTDGPKPAQTERIADLETQIGELEEKIGELDKRISEIDDEVETLKGGVARLEAAAEDRAAADLTPDDLKLDADERQEIEDLLDRIDQEQFKLRAKLAEVRDAWLTVFANQPEEWRASEESTAARSRIENLGCWISELYEDSNYRIGDIDG
jgi:chromosome segregation ATPase